MSGVDLRAPGHRAIPQFGLLQYRTWNLGDEIQSLAARQFLPSVDARLDRDRIASDSAKLAVDTKVILNGWWMHGAEWPPGEKLIPLLTSMFFDHRHPSVRRALVERPGRQFLEDHGPVGARDHATLEFLEREGIPAFFSGCLTLTLRRDPMVTGQDFVLAVDLPGPVLSALRAQSDRPVIELSTYHEPSMGVEERFTLAELYLLFYQSAAAVVTTRLHAFLPSIALETPTLLVRTPSTYDAQRFSGLEDLGVTCSQEEFLAGSFDPTITEVTGGSHLPLRRQLERQASVFTGAVPVEVQTSRYFSDPLVVPELARLIGGQVRRARAGRAMVDHIDNVGSRPVGLARVAGKLIQRARNRG